jgi:hypothetical protein
LGGSLQSFRDNNKMVLLDLSRPQCLPQCPHFLLELGLEQQLYPQPSLKGLTPSRRSLHRNLQVTQIHIPLLVLREKTVVHLYPLCPHNKDMIIACTARQYNTLLMDHRKLLKEAVAFATTQPRLYHPNLQGNLPCESLIVQSVQ